MRFGSELDGTSVFRDALTNPAVARAGLDRLRHKQRRRPFDSRIQELVAVADDALAGVSRPDSADASR